MNNPDRMSLASIFCLKNCKMVIEYRYISGIMEEKCPIREELRCINGEYRK